MKAQVVWLWTAVVIAALIVAVAVYHDASMPTAQVKQSPVRVGNAELRAKIVAEDPELQRGLSGSQPLADDEAMLFVFPASSKWGIWMKEMNYPIDIVWMDDDKVVRHLVKNAQPSSYPEVFKPPTEVRYVLEMKAGTVRHKRITIGARAEFDVAHKEL